MPDFTIPLLSTTQETSDVKHFRFTLQGGTFPFQAGQFLKLTLPDVINDPRGPWRFFSIASSPTEKDFIMIATKISESPFKKRLASLAVGETVTIAGPFGKFTLSEDPHKTHVFLSGGIGITPFRSIVKYATDMKLPHKLLLLYSNKTSKDIVFKEDLNQFAKANPNLTIVHTITRAQKQTTKNSSHPGEPAMAGDSRISTGFWTSSSTALSSLPKGQNDAHWKTGRIDQAMIKEYVKDLANAIFYICGPPSMVEALLMVVKRMGIPEENIKTERFTGYA